MIEYFINVAYTENQVKLTRIMNGQKDLSPQTHALAFLMMAAGIDRIMDRPALYELLSRIVIMLKHLNVVDNFFRDDTLFTIRAYDYNYKMTMKDMEEHLGMEISNSPDDIVPRKSWFKNIRKYWKAACIASIFQDNPLMEKERVGNNTYEIKSYLDKEITQEYLATVDLFAREAIKCIPDDKFKELHFRVAHFRQEIVKYRKELKKKPKHKFDYAKISRSVKTKLMKTCFGYIQKKDVREAMYNEPVFINLCYLAWLWSNNYVRVYQVELDDKKAYTADVDPRMPFNYDDFDGLNSLQFGINIYETFYDFNLDKVYELLKEED